VQHQYVNGDPGRLRQIINNLLSNAIKFTEQGEIIVFASLSQTTSGNLSFHCSVSDTGIGIPEEKIPSLFVQFSQVDASTTRKYGGTGLGLSIARKLCELMDGSIKAASILGQGSVFEFDIMFKPCQDDSSHPAIDEIPSYSILVCDDNKACSSAIKKQLKNWGHKVTVCQESLETYTLVQTQSESNNNTFDAVFIDRLMPDMNGIELARKIRSESAYDNIKLVLMTPMNKVIDPGLLIDAGITTHFVKPATITDLRGALHAIQQNVTETSDKPSISPYHPIEREVTRSAWPNDARLLLVEDNHVNQEVAKGMLGAIGFNMDIVNTAANGQEALHELMASSQSMPYTIILMDCQMPIMDGYEATRNIRAGLGGEQNKDIPILALTANAMKGDQEKCFDAGMSDYMAKPIDPETLAHKLGHWLQSNNTSSPPAEIITKPSKDNDSAPQAIISHEEAIINQKEAIISQEKAIIWDKDAALKRLLNKEALLEKLTRAVLADLPSTTDFLYTAIEKADLEQIKLHAHSLKGMFANLSAIQLTGISAELELAAKEGDMNKVNQLLPDFQTSLPLFMDQLEDYLG
jgi:two-component system, sensor histidine kinase and response regulator